MVADHDHGAVRPRGTYKACVLQCQRGDPPAADRRKAQALSRHPHNLIRIDCAAAVLLPELARRAFPHGIYAAASHKRRALYHARAGQKAQQARPSHHVHTRRDLHRRHNRFKIG